MKAGFIAIVGRPNVGKSTLMNKLIDEKLAITSNVSGTTRDQIRGIANIGENQYIFFDTPGIHKPKHILGEYMTEVALNTLSEADIILFVIDGKEKIGTGDKFVMENIRSVNKPCVLIINKSDQLTDKEVEDKKMEINENLGEFIDILPLSAQYGIGTHKIYEICNEYLSSNIWFYPEDYYTDMPVNKIVVEVIREKILHLTRDEIPHSVLVEITDVNTKPNIRHYEVNIYVERASQKGIIIGENGKLIKEIGILSRKEIENLIGMKVNLKLWVKVKKKWRKDKKFLEDMGYKI